MIRSSVLVLALFLAGPALAVNTDQTFDKPANWVDEGDHAS